MEVKTVIDGLAAALVSAGYTRSTLLAIDLGAQKAEQLSNTIMDKTFILDYSLQSIEERTSKTYSYSIPVDILVLRKVGTVNQGTRATDVDNCNNENCHLLDHLQVVDLGGNYRKPDSVVLDGGGDDFVIFVISVSMKFTRQNTHVSG